MSTTREDPPVRWLSVSEAAGALHVTSATVRSWIRNGHLKAARPGGPHGSLRVHPSELERLGEEHPAA